MRISFHLYVGPAGILLSVDPQGGSEFGMALDWMPSRWGWGRYNAPPASLLALGPLNFFVHGEDSDSGKLILARQV